MSGQGALSSAASIFAAPPPSVSSLDYFMTGRTRTSPQQQAVAGFRPEAPCIHQILDLNPDPDATCVAPQQQQARAAFTPLCPPPTLPRLSPLISSYYAEEGGSADGDETLLDEVRGRQACTFL